MSTKPSILAIIPRIRPNGNVITDDSIKDLGRRVRNGIAFGEFGQPRRLPHQTDQSWLGRICEVHEANIALKVISIEATDENLIVMITPMMMRHIYLEDTAYSILPRSVTDPNGKLIVVTFDLVARSKTTDIRMYREYHTPLKKDMLSNVCTLSNVAPPIS